MYYMFKINPICMIKLTIVCKERKNMIISAIKTTTKILSFSFLSVSFADSGVFLKPQQYKNNTNSLLLSLTNPYRPYAPSPLYTSSPFTSDYQFSDSFQQQCHQYNYYPLHLCPRRPLHRLCGMMTMMMTKKTKRCQARSLEPSPIFSYMETVSFSDNDEDDNKGEEECFGSNFDMFGDSDNMPSTSTFPPPSTTTPLPTPRSIMDTDSDECDEEEQQHQHRLLPPLLLSLSGSLKLN
ncbi:WSSV334 [White spot syndrome virus]|uniref:WSSV334 n=1 Tax=White spot syndrome virus TaxID=342409 RepID=A0A2I6SC39_9VIRU|nr:WSSV334 [White spot syndrome virus]